MKWKQDIAGFMHISLLKWSSPSRRKVILFNSATFSIASASSEQFTFKNNLGILANHEILHNDLTLHTGCLKKNLFLLIPAQLIFIPFTKVNSAHPSMNFSGLFPPESYIFFTPVSKVYSWVFWDTRYGIEFKTNP